MFTTNLPGEQWKEVNFDHFKPRLRYAISNHGRIKSYVSTIEESNLLKGGNLGGYPILKTRMNGKDRTIYLHKLVAQYFLTIDSPSHEYVIHLDYNKRNNHFSNLKWVTREEMLAHHKTNPNIIEARKHIPKPQKGHKLTSTEVLRIKKIIANPNRKTRMKIIAKQFGISEMQLYRIKSGENWSHIKLEEADVN